MAGKGNLGAGPGRRGCAVSRDFKQIEGEIAQAARWAVKWRLLQNEALGIAGAMRDPEARSICCPLLKAYRLLAEPGRRSNAEHDWLELASHMKKR